MAAHERRAWGQAFSSEPTNICCGGLFVDFLENEFRWGAVIDLVRVISRP
jgi:hypothetical protein